MFNAFFDLIYYQLFAYGYVVNMNTTVLGVSINFGEYISMILALICTITVFVVVVLLIWKVIKLFGRLWSRF